MLILDLHPQGASKRLVAAHHRQEVSGGCRCCIQCQAPQTPRAVRERAKLTTGEMGVRPPPHMGRGGGWEPDYHYGPGPVLIFFFNHEELINAFPKHFHLTPGGWGLDKPNPFLILPFRPGEFSVKKKSSKYLQKFILSDQLPPGDPYLSPHAILADYVCLVLRLVQASF